MGAVGTGAISYGIWKHYFDCFNFYYGLYENFPDNTENKYWIVHFFSRGGRVSKVNEHFTEEGAPFFYFVKSSKSKGSKCPSEVETSNGCFFVKKEELSDEQAKKVRWLKTMVGYYVLREDEHKLDN
ncbi:MAG: hypothetical protein RsTaC01_0787 [Candidatus Paraimprobicoccus trichonymphae]|uniref:Uncharacterized protein n=1 Tax=Candidatus Paraimprobicoccus trichonymphae TaxID=3033793 RepID=A0AA48I020_9FIRM|nr:MAG: hypothetical protein RsTaC01_0787 [Candidatus Paraimprobicoccus trichonymphae]